MSVKSASFRSDYRAPEFQIKTVDLTFHLNDSATRVHNTMRIEPLSNSNQLVLHGENIQLKRVAINGTPLNDSRFEVNSTSLCVVVPSEPFELTIETEINPAANKALEGLYKSGGAFCTQCEAEGFRRITYYLDRPDVLAQFTTTIIGERSKYPFLLSNGNAIAQGDNADGTHWVTWHDPHPKPAYLFALVAGNFEVLNDTFLTQSGREVKLQLFVDKGNLSRAEFAMTSLKNAMRWDEQRFGLEYDLDIYMIVAVDFFNMGAMENKGLNVFNSRYVLADRQTATDQDFLNVESVIGHEYFHNWTGNRITCRDWFQLSLKEGLTVFRDQEFSSDLGSRSVNRIDAIRVMRTHQFNEDASPMAHPIRPDKVVEMNNFYTVTVYNKGAEVIRMLHTLLGEDGFQAGMRLYVERHDGQAVTCDDFVAAMADANQVDLSLFKRWYSQAGTPVVDVQEFYDAKQQQLTLRFAQHTPATQGQPDKQAVHIPILFSLYDQQGQRLSLATNAEQSGWPSMVREHESGSFLFELTENTAEITLQTIPTKPVVALNENFSAPIKLNFVQSFAEKVVLLGSAEQEITRWEAAQQLFTQLIRDSVASEQALKLPSEVVHAMRQFVLSNMDASLKALVLTPPTVEEIAEYYATDIPLKRIKNAVEQLRQQLAEHLFEEFSSIWKQNSNSAYRLTGEAIAQRSLYHAVLFYLALHKPHDYSDIVAQYYHQADNMTAQQAALQIAVHLRLPCHQHLLNAFEQQWMNEPLVLDKWFAIQASAPQQDVIEIVAQLHKHSRFNTDNPNRVYALFATLGRNMTQFHREDGAGYALMAGVIRYLNEKNPQVAARLVTPLTQWRRFDPTRQQQLKAVLNELQQLSNLAPDLDEKISQSLAPM